MLMKKIVLKIGGSVLYRKENMTLNVELIKEYIKLINDLYEANHQIAIVVGGGKLARSIIARQARFFHRGSHHVLELGTLGVRRAFP